MGRHNSKLSESSGTKTGYLDWSFYRKQHDQRRISNISYAIHSKEAYPETQPGSPMTLITSVTFCHLLEYISQYISPGSRLWLVNHWLPTNIPSPMELFLQWRLGKGPVMKLDINESSTKMWSRLAWNYIFDMNTYLHSNMHVSVYIYLFVYISVSICIYICIYYWKSKGVANVSWCTLLKASSKKSPENRPKAQRN